MDATALYSSTISHYKLPHSNFEWVIESELDELSKSFMNIAEDVDKGYIVVVDVDSPKELHDKHSD